VTEKQDRARLGSARATPDPFHGSILGGTLVVAPDGLFQHARSDRIASVCADGTTEATLAERLVALPRRPSGAYPDDMAVVMG
jgi:hypothetical protein